MTLNMLSSEVLQLMLGALVVGRMIFPLEAYTRSHGTRAVSWVVTLAMTVPLWDSFFHLGGHADTGSLPSGLMVIALGFMWALSVLPTRSVCPSHRLPSPMLRSGWAKVATVFMLGILLFFPAGFAAFYAVVYFANHEKYRFVSQTELLMPHALSVVMVAYFCVSMFTPISDEALCIGLVSTAGAHYFGSGFRKLRTGWIWGNRLGNIAIAAKTQNGWSLLSHHRLGRSLIFRTAFFAQLVVVFIEIFAMWSFLDRRLVYMFFPLLIVMHVGILLSTGIFFWKWIIALVGVLLVQWSAGAIPINALDPLSLVVLIVSAAGLPFLSSTMATLAWFDTPVSRTFSFVLRAGDSEAALNPYDVAPLDVLLSQARHEFYFDGALHSLDCFGTSKNRALAIALNSLSCSPKTSEVEQRDQAIVLLRSLGSTSMHRSRVKREIRLLIEQLRHNLASPSKIWIPNFHIWNMNPRTDSAVVRSILSDPEAELWGVRRVYMYCRSKDESILIDEQRVQLPLEHDLIDE